MRLAKLLAAIGRTCITAGALILLFVAYQLWGTGIRAAQAQDKLDAEFAALLDEAAATSTTSTTSPPTTETTATTVPVTAPPLPPVAEGDPVAHIVVPKIGLDWKVLEGVALSVLKGGPGHYEQTPMPGQKGNAAIAGHRTTYGAPFNRIDELVPGDEIMVETLQGQFTYIVKEQQIVSPEQVDVLDDKGDNRLTLTACHPKYSARQRIVVVAELAPDEVPLARPVRPEQQPRPVSVGSIGGEGASKAPTVALGLACAVIWFVAWFFARRWIRWLSYAIGLPVFSVTLFVFFEEFSRFLPSDF
jgi:sortase A